MPSVLLHSNCRGLYFISTNCKEIHWKAGSLPLAPPGKPIDMSLPGYRSDGPKLLLKETCPEQDSTAGRGSGHLVTAPAPLIPKSLTPRITSSPWEHFQRWNHSSSKQPIPFLDCSNHKAEKAMATHSSTLAWKIPWMEGPGRLQSMGSLATSLSLFTFMHWRRKWQPTPVFLPGESQGWGSLVGCRLWGRTESDTTEAT